MIDDEQAEVLTTRDLEKMLKIPRKTQMDLRARGDSFHTFLPGTRCSTAKRPCRAGSPSPDHPGPWQDSRGHLRRYPA